MIPFLRILLVALVLGIVAVGPARPVQATTPPVPFPGSIFYSNVAATPLHPNDAAYRSILAGSTTKNLFSSGYYNGYPVGFRAFDSSATATVPVTVDEFPQFTGFTSMPKPDVIPLEAPPDLHLSMLDTNTGLLYEGWHVRLANSLTPSYVMGSNVVFNTTSNAMPPAGWGAADAAGRPMYPLLYRVNETNAAAIKHAARLTLPAWKVSSTAIEWPARHTDGTGGANAIPMGARLRLRSDYSLTCEAGTTCAQAQAIVAALKTYGGIVTDTDASDDAVGINGNWDTAWGVDDVRQLRNIPISAWEFVNQIQLQVDPNSYLAQ